MKRLIRITASFLPVFIILSACLSASAVSSGQLSRAYQTAESYLLSGPSPQFGSIGGEWTVIGLARSGKLSDKAAEEYYLSVEDFVKENGSAKLHRSKSTENSRVIIALTSIGKNPENVAGYNLLEPLADFGFVTKQGLNGPVWALIALDSLSYEIPKTEAKQQTTRELLIKYILDSELETGGWDFNNNSADPDMTAMAVQALSPYCKSDSAVKAAVDKALGVLSASQRENGNFSTYGDDTPESCAQVITALSSLGIDCEKQSDFIKNNRSAFDSMLSFRLTDGSFEHVKGNGANRMATEQAYYAMTAYYRMKDGKTALYDMSDLLIENDLNLDGTVDVNDVTILQKQIASLVAFSVRQERLADINSDGDVDVNDVTRLQKIIAGITV